MSDFKLGDKVRDMVSGIEGIATGRTLWLNGCERWTVSPMAQEDGKLPDDICIDRQQMRLVKSDPIGLSGADTAETSITSAGASVGGPTSSTPRKF